MPLFLACAARVRGGRVETLRLHGVFFKCGGLVSVQAEVWHPLPWNFLWFKVKIPSFLYDRGRQGSGQVPNVVGHPATVSA